MAFSYDFAAFAKTNAGTYAGSTDGVRYQIRFWILDTKDSTTPGRPYFQDEEIDWVQTTQPNVYLMAAELCESMAARLGAVQSKRVADLAVTYNPAFWRERAAMLRARGASGQAPYMGGISIADKDAQQSNPDAVPPRAFKGEFDHPGAEQPQPGSSDSGLFPMRP